ncbi:anti-sigma factor [Streptomyces sp. NPDC057740]|uniref:anti-sigma factor n=1 Tax=Streptomyces sp. NPDC057740 TaxID=3346234 RepID=UPI0036C43A4F
MMRRDVHDELRARLHEAAEGHEPDRARILARIERGMAAPSGQSHRDHRASRPPVYGWARVVTATAAVAGVLAVGGYAVASAVKEDTPQQTVATSPTPAPSPDATSRPPAPPAPPADPTPGDTPGSRGTNGAPTRQPTPTAAPPAAEGEEDGPLWSDGSVDPHSNDFWAQSNLTLKTSEQLTALTVRLRVAQTGGVNNAGAWRSLPEDDFTLTVEEKDGFLVYTWVLKEGRTVRAGEWVFAGQYDHERGGRDAQDDRYAMTATAGGEQLSVAGGFAAHDDNDSAADGDS